jgi:hypothetical protein
LLSVAVLVQGGTVVGWAGDEHPSRVMLTDDRGDVWSWSHTSGESTLIGQKPTVDVIRARAAHRPRAVTSTTRVVELRRVGPFQDHAMRVRTPTGFFAVWVLATKGNWAGQHGLFDLETSERVRCPRLSHNIDYEANRVTVAVPRTCIGTPKWVRLSLQSSLGGRDRTHSDNPHNAAALPGAQGTIRLYHS